MPLEATLILIDNSEYMRNGDYVPSRWDAQSDAVNTVFQTKIDSNPENTVGMMSMAGKAPEVLVTHSKDLGAILSAMHSVTSNNKMTGYIDIPTSLSIAQLALKHRENKNLRQRIILFVGSPVQGGEMTKLGKKLKKNNVAVDVVCFGDALGEEGGENVLRGLVESVNSSDDNSHLLTVPPGHSLLSDALITSPILSADRSAAIPDELNPAAASGSGGQDNSFEFGVDPSLDPELAMALRMSMQEAQAREAAQAQAQASQQSKPEPEKAPADPTDNEEEAMLQQAIAMSQQEPQSDVNMNDEDEEDEDAAIQRAIAMSMEQDQPEEGAERKDKK